jgi:exonuclease III
MAISNTISELRLCSFNMHGYRNGLSMANSLCSDHDIILLQEHWLMKHELHKMDAIHPNFKSFGVSSMDNKIASGILVGRPFGGVGILWNKRLSSKIQILDYDADNGKFLTIKILADPKHITITTVYFPCVGHAKDYIIGASVIIAHIENVIKNYHQASHIVAGDFNFECAKGNIGFDIFNDLVTAYNLICCDSMVSDDSVHYTYCHETLNQSSWLDHLFVSSDICQYLSRVRIIDSGANTSDHLPISCSLQLSCDNVDSQNANFKRWCKDRWDKADLLQYYYESGTLLQDIIIPKPLLLCAVGCNCSMHTTCIDNYYESMVHALKLAGSRAVPNIPINSLKGFWNSELDSLKEISIDMHKLWRTIGCPRQGVINAARLKAKLKYKQAIKQANIDFERDNSDAINDCIGDKDSNRFWKSWNARYNKKTNYSGAVDGCSDSKDIANRFKTFYSNIYINSAADIDAVHEFSSIKSQINNSTNINNLDVFADVVSIERCISMLKLNKAAGYDSLVAEHIVHSHPSIVLHLKLLFSMMLIHAYVPNAFGIGLVVPIIKDRHGDPSAVDNYRPITLSPVISKIFESFLLEKYSKFLPTDDLQFGFKKGLSCSHAVFALRQTIQYFNCHGSNVYLASLDASKAFDRVNHFKLFSVLFRAGAPNVFIRLIINWYGKLSISVKWNGCLSSSTAVKSGVRQGGIMSPALFNCYVNSMLVTLRGSDYGCRLPNCYMGCIMYADDLILISGSVLDLQVMLDLCTSVGQDLNIKFNNSKSKCIMIGPTITVKPSPMIIDGQPMCWVDKIKYLGVWILAGRRFEVDHSETRRSFFSSVNAILAKAKFTSDIVKLRLVESHCLPILMYSIESKDLSMKHLKLMNSWWNSVYRKIFGFHKWESVKNLICLLGRLDVIHLENLRRLTFLKRLSCDMNMNTTLLSILKFYVSGGEFSSVLIKYDSQWNWSQSKIKAMMFVHFKNKCQPVS